MSKFERELGVVSEGDKLELLDPGYNLDMAAGVYTVINVETLPTGYFAHVRSDRAFGAWLDKNRRLFHEGIWRIYD